MFWKPQSNLKTSDPKHRREKNRLLWLSATAHAQKINKRTDRDKYDQFCEDQIIVSPINGDDMINVFTLWEMRTRIIGHRRKNCFGLHCKLDSNFCLALKIV